MPITKSLATAFINVRGLGIICFNPQKKRCETAIIRNSDHKLNVNIFKPAFIDGGNTDKLGYTPIFSREITELEDVSLEISGVGNPGNDGFDLYENGDFDRLNGENDENDLRWILNLEGEEMHRATLSKNQQFTIAEKPPVTKLYISNGLFYAVMPNDNDLTDFPFFRKNDPYRNVEEDFGYIAETLGVNINSDEVVFKLKIGTVENTLSLRKIDGIPYKIEITNVDEKPEAPLSDLPICYKFLSPTDGMQFDLKALEQDAAEGKPVRGKQYCHITRVNQESLDSFI
ncbi:MAG: hypothetical protein LUM44_07570 [Pyrinomonadaceae bacterium]|nr:hypothetical protein [Pyrinomonadaceae bacterium]